MLKDLPTLLLVLATILIGVFFFRVVQPFVLPLVLAGVCAVLVWPVQKRLTSRLWGRGRIAAVFCTLLVVLVVLIPITIGLIAATNQLSRLASHLLDNGSGNEVLPAIISEPDTIDDATSAAMEPWSRYLPSWVSRQQFKYIQRLAAEGIQDATNDIYQRTIEMVANTIGVIVGAVVFLLALYYFLAENSKLLLAVQRLSPLESEDDEAIWATFVRACRGMLLGTILAGALQAVLAAAGFAVAGIQGVLLLALLTFIFSVIPYLGAASVWIPVAVYLAFQDRWLAAALLVAYGTLIISSLDNIVRAYAIHDQARIHPLVALIAILGAIRLLGLWGIIVGPVTAVMFHVLLVLVKQKLDVARSKPSPTRDHLTHPL